MKIRPFFETDYERCLEIFDSNCPAYFFVDERDEFAEWLRVAKEPYWVIEENEKIVGCGGVYRAEQHTKSSAEYADEVGFAWGMVDARYHKKGFGKTLSEYRVNYLKNNFAGRPIVLRTSHLTSAFFEKMGFSTKEFIQDGWEKGLHKVVMVYGEN